MSAHVLAPVAVNSISERKVNSLPPLGFDPVIFGMLAHLFNHSAKPHPQIHFASYLVNIIMIILCRSVLTRERMVIGEIDNWSNTCTRERMVIGEIDNWSNTCTSIELGVVQL
jgi:hypothetical protein